MAKLFHYTHYLQYLFAMPALYYIFQGSVYHHNDYMNKIGIGIFFLGISFAFGSMSDIRKVSLKEKKLFSNPKKYKQKVKSLVIMGMLMIIVSLFFISIKWINNGNELLSEQYYQLGLNCLPLVIAIFFELKQTNDKKDYFDLKNKKLLLKNLTTS